MEAESLSVDGLVTDAQDLKIDVFGPVGMITFIAAYEFIHEDERVASRSRSTMVVVNDGTQWLIAHEHHSPFKAGP